MLTVYGTVFRVVQKKLERQHLLVKMSSKTCLVESQHAHWSGCLSFIQMMIFLFFCFSLKNCRKNYYYQKKRAQRQIERESENIERGLQLHKVVLHQFLFVCLFVCLFGNSNIERASHNGIVLFSLAVQEKTQDFFKVNLEPDS